MPNSIPRRNFLPQMSVCVVYLMLCTLYFQTYALYFHDHIMSLLTHEFTTSSAENIALDVVNPKNSCTVILCITASPFLSSNQRQAIISSYCFHQASPAFSTLKESHVLPEVFCFLVICHVSVQLCFSY